MTTAPSVEGSAPSTTKQFNPDKYLIKLKGKEYLEVKWRILWAHTDNPDKPITITTEIVHHDEKTKMVIVKATVVIGANMFTAHGSEDVKDFGDYIEKAETKAVGRALALAGYGTQFSGEIEFKDDGTGIADAPVARPIPAMKFKPKT